MSTSTGLMRLGTALTVIGYIFFALFAAVFFFGNDKGFVDHLVTGGIFLGVPGAGFWVVGWIVQGFAKD